MQAQIPTLGHDIDGLSMFDSVIQHIKCQVPPCSDITRHQHDGHLQRIECLMPGRKENSGGVYEFECNLAQLHEMVLLVFKVHNVFLYLPSPTLILSDIFVAVAACAHAQTATPLYQSTPHHCLPADCRPLHPQQHSYAGPPCHSSCQHRYQVPELPLSSSCQTP